MTQYHKPIDEEYLEGVVADLRMGIDRTYGLFVCFESSDGKPFVCFGDTHQGHDLVAKFYSEKRFNPAGIRVEHRGGGQVKLSNQSIGSPRVVEFFGYSGNLGRFEMRVLELAIEATRKSEFTYSIRDR